MKASLLALALLGAPPDFIAPSIDDLDRRLTRLEGRLDDASSAEAEWSRLQRAWVDAGCADWRCPVDAGARLAKQQIEAARAVRRSAQAARAENQRVLRILAFEAVGPLVDGARRARHRGLGARVDRASAAYSARLAWHTRYVALWARTYARQVEGAFCEPAP